MVANRAGVFFHLISLAIVLPLFNFARFYPLPDWVSSALALVFVGLALLFALFDRAEGRVSFAFVTTMLLAIYCLLQYEMDGLPFGLVLILLSAVMLFIPFYASIDLKGGIVLLATWLLLAALLQCMLGWLQLLGLAPKMYGFVLFDAGNPTGNVMGNIGQRNLYAEFLVWGSLSACYLFSIKKLGKCLFVFSLFSLVLMIAWTGSRLPLGYAVGLIFLVWFWLRRSSGKVEVQRMAIAISCFVILLSLTQFFNHEIIWFLNKIGLNIAAVSGSERILDAGFGARRRVEWSKAWDIFKSHPWFGVGFGGFAAASTRMEVFSGFAKVPESYLFTHSHNIFFQLLAESGVVGTLIVLIGGVVSMLGFFVKGKQSVEGFLLVGVVLVLMIHSMFEYPLWYLSFLLMLCVAASLSSVGHYTFSIKSRLLSIYCLIIIFLCFSYVFSGVFVYSKLVRYSSPPVDRTLRVKAIKELGSVANYPLWSWDVDMAMANYLEPSREGLSIKLAFFERIANYRPYPAVLVKLSMLQALNRQPEQARETLRIAIANYPDYSARLALMFAYRSEKELMPLQSMVMNAAAAYGRFAVYSDQARNAAVMTVVEPVTRKTLF